MTFCANYSRTINSGTVWPERGVHLQLRCICLVMGDIVAKRFLASERETLIQYRARASNVWITNPFPPIRLSRISILHFLRGDFCNNIGTCETSTDVRYTAASKGNPDIEPTLAKTGFDVVDGARSQQRGAIG
jgi:hypothetical protein